MWGGEGVSGGGGGGVSSSQLAGMLIGYATETWVDEHYISIDFFSRLFQAHGTENGSEIDVMPNDMDTTITSVESMFGFWTNLYISALGSNGAAPAGISLGMLTDVTISGTPSAGQVLTFDAVTQKWVNGNAQAGVTALANLTDVTLTSLENGQTLLYDSTTSKWYNSALKTINGQSLLGSGDISVGGGASGYYLPLTGGTLVGALSIAIGGGEALSMFSSTANYTCIVYVPNNGYQWAVGAYNDGTFYFWNSSNNSIVSYFNSSGTLFTNNTYPSICANFSGIPKMKVGYYDVGGYSYFSNETNSWEIELFNNGGLAYKQWSTGITLLELAYNGKLTINSSNSSNYVAQFNNSVSHCGLVINAKSGFNPYIQFRAADSGIAELGTSADSYFYIGPPNSANGILNVMISTYRVGINTTSPSYTLHVAGTIYATGAITALSDARKKDITGEAGVTVEQIAHAPAVQFLWKDKERRKDGVQVGTLAQYWRTVLPEVVSDKGGELSMQYGVAALVSSIIIARKVANHEVRIDKMEKWMKKWAEENDE